MAAEDDKKLSALGERLIEQIIKFGISGAGPFKGAVPIADEHLVAAGGDRQEAVRRLVATHVRLAAVSGFATGLGGIVTLPIAIPAAMTGLYIIATRMSGGIAHLHGYDVDTDEIRSAILVTLLGSAGATVLGRTGVEVGKKTTAAALQKIPGRVLIELNKRVGFRLVTKAGQKGVINLTKLVPLVGGPIGAAVDGVSCKAIASYAMRTFEVQEHIAARRPEASAEPDVIDAQIVDNHDVELADPVEQLRANLVEINDSEQTCMTNAVASTSQGKSIPEVQAVMARCRQTSAAAATTAIDAFLGECSEIDTQANSFAKTAILAATAKSVSDFWVKSESNAAAFASEAAAQLLTQGLNKTNQAIKNTCSDRASSINRYFAQLTT